MTDLAITSRCREEDLLGALAPDVAEHVLAVFAAHRGANPQSGETMAQVGGPVRKLHADLSGGRSVRAVTWHDPGRDVCWLLAAGMHEGFYEGVESLARAGELFPTSEDVGNFEADAPVRLVERVVRNASAALEAAIAAPGVEVPVTKSPPPSAYFLVEGDRLWVRVVMFGREGYRLTTKQLAAIQATVFGDAPAELGYPDDAVWDSVYLVGPLPSMDSWPPPVSLE